MLCFCGIMIFFYFKQKTAYEMRISDWSSDVCSSDLEGPGLTNLEYALCAEEMGRIGFASEVFNCSAPDTGNMEVFHRYGTAAQKERWLKQIGRASCRERVCQYVSMSVVAGALKKKKYNNSTRENKNTIKKNS